jgi:hypothetical protein
MKHAVDDRKLSSRRNPLTKARALILQYIANKEGVTYRMPSLIVPERDNRQEIRELYLLS